MNSQYTLLQLQKSGALATIIVDNPPVNVITSELFAELLAVFEDVGADPNLTVVVMKSKNPDFFLAHFDVEILLALSDAPAEEATATLESYHQMLRGIREMDKVVIGQIEGRIGGGGAELAMNFDMRFGVKGKTLFNQMEVPLGILPGGSGTQMLPRLVGQSRAMEIILGGDDIDAETAEAWGLLNRAFSADAIEDWVAKFAARMASFPVQALRTAKTSIACASKPLAEGLQDEGEMFVELLFTDDAKHQMTKFMAAGGQTHDGELRISKLSQEICSGDSSEKQS
jgi:enoyl-CoA hydratase/carnithine racemase